MVQSYRRLCLRSLMSWSDGYNYCLLQRGNEYYEDSEDSQSSQETDSSQEGTEHLTLGRAY